MGLNGLANVNIELTSRCNKDCWMCGRRQRDRERGDQEYGDMPMALVESIAKQIPGGISVQLHNNGEPLLYPGFGLVLYYFEKHITNIVTNGKLLTEIKFQLVGNGIIPPLDTMSVSVFEGDPEQGEQLAILKEFLQYKGDRKPYTTARLIGKVDPAPYEALGLQIVKRTLHKPQGSVFYRREAVIPEVGYCWDLFTRIAIDRWGLVSVCVRYDPDGELVIGDLAEESLEDIWNGYKRKQLLEKHIAGKRNELPYCGKKCHYWGIPIGS